VLKLTIKNFGVLKDIEMQLHKTNLFIGDNGSGKSTLAKLITVLTDFTASEEKILQRLKDFNIDFLNEKCFINLSENNKTMTEIVAFKIKISIKRKETLNRLKTFKGSIKFNNLITQEENRNNLENFLQNIKTTNKDLARSLTKLSKDYEHRDLLSKIHENINNLQSTYIPAERNLISLFNQSLSNIISANIPLPKTLLEFSAHYNSARNVIRELDILDMKYKNENAQDRIYYETGNSLALEYSSSGIQSALPLYLTLKYFSTKHDNIIVEEPELNLYPKSQIDTLKYMIENSKESSLYIMTHSPYILSVLNLLLFAYKASNTNDVLKEKISTIIPQKQHINPDDFSAYLIKDGTSKSIKGASSGMIQENVIDEIGGMLDENYSELLEIYSEFKNDT